MGTLPHLPPELISHILSYLAAGRDRHRNYHVNPLLNACLVSRKFYEIAQPWLYATIQLDISSPYIKRLTHKLQPNPYLANGVKELSVIQSGSAYYGMQLLTFLEGVLPLLTGLVSFRTSSDTCTNHLIRAALFKVGSSSYQMGVPSDLTRLRSLELCAHAMVFEYNYILRLPQLETVRLNELHVYDADETDPPNRPDDWGWVSKSIKSLTLRPEMLEYHRWGTAVHPLRTNSLVALARCMPNLETLVIKQLEKYVVPGRFRQLYMFFEEQIRGSVRRLELRDGPASYVNEGIFVADGFDRAAIHDIAQSGISDLAIDSHLFLRTIPEASLVDEAVIPASVRRLIVRHTDTGNGDELMRMWNMHGSQLVEVVARIRASFPLLEFFKLKLGSPAIFTDDALRAYKRSFADVGIDFRVHGGGGGGEDDSDSEGEVDYWDERYLSYHDAKPRQIGTITCSRRSTLETSFPP